MRMMFAIYVGASVLASGCSSPAHDNADAAIDAPPSSDARIDAVTCSGTSQQCGEVCVDTTQNRDHCGACDHACTPAADCEASACECPAPFVLADSPVVAAQMIAAQPGYLSGAVAVTGPDGNVHAVLVTVEDDVPTGTQLPVNMRAFVLLGYEVLSANEVRSAYLASAGTVRVTRRCAAALGGTVQNLTLAEVDPDTFTPIAGGCTTTLPSFPFSIGGACP